MGVDKKKLAGGYKKIFTKQDYLDGKCTQDGQPIDEAEKKDPKPVLQEPTALEEIEALDEILAEEVKEEKAEEGDDSYKDED